MTFVLKLEGINHWVVNTRADGSSEGIDYDVVRMFCGLSMRFRRPGILDGKVYAPIVEGIPECLRCVVQQVAYTNALSVMDDAGGDKGVDWLHKQMGGVPL
jgi:hypothetical protein